jgi:hypothetical protein
VSSQVVNFTNDPNQSGELALSIDGTQKSYLYSLRFNEVANYWVGSLYTLTGGLILDSIAFVTGNGPAANVLRQFAYLAIGSLTIANQSSASSPDYPNQNDLGSDFVPIWYDTPTQ